VRAQPDQDLVERWTRLETIIGEPRAGSITITTVLTDDLVSLRSC
jgi:hypothetical protein